MRLPLLHWLTFTLLFSIVAIFSEELTFHQYKKKGTGFKLLMIRGFRTFCVASIYTVRGNWGNIDYYFNKKKRWGEMTKKGNGKSRK